MGIKRWQGNTSALWLTAANWIGGVAPVAGDDVKFLAGDLGTNKCTTGPGTLSIATLTVEDQICNCASAVTVTGAATITFPTSTTGNVTVPQFAYPGGCAITSPYALALGTIVSGSILTVS